MDITSIQVLSKRNSKLFGEIFAKTFELTNRLGIGHNDADGELWKTSVPKLIDNSILDWKSEPEEVRALFN
jgi:hypothetical protein